MVPKKGFLMPVAGDTRMTDCISIEFTVAVKIQESSSRNLSASLAVSLSSSLSGTVVIQEVQLETDLGCLSEGMLPGRKEGYERVEEIVHADMTMMEQQP